MDRASTSTAMLETEAREVWTRVRQTPVVSLRLDLIDTDDAWWNPRTLSGDAPYTEERLAGLMSAIDRVGQFQPVLVRPHPQRPGRFQLIYGFRRYFSHRFLGADELLAQVGHFGDTLLSLVATMENSQRDPLGQFESIRGVFVSVAGVLGVEQAEVPKMITRVLNSGKDPDGLADLVESLSSYKLSSFSSKYSRVLQVSAEEHQAVQRGETSTSVVLEIVRLKDRAERQPMLRRAVAEGWTALDARREVNALLRPIPATPSVTSRARAVVARLDKRFLNSRTEVQREQIERVLAELESLTA